MGARFGVTLDVVSSPVGLELGDLVGLALRRNPRRAHLLVSRVLGKHIPVTPDVAVAAGRLLGELVTLERGGELGHADRAAFSRLSDEICYLIGTGGRSRNAHGDKCASQNGR